MKLFQAQGNKEGNILQEGWEGVAQAEIRDFWKETGAGVASIMLKTRSRK